MWGKINRNDPDEDDLMLNRIPQACGAEFYSVWRMIFLAKQGLVTMAGKIFYQWQVHHENHTYNMHTS